MALHQSTSHECFLVSEPLVFSFAVPQSRTKTFGDAALSCYTPNCWNNHPSERS